MAIPRSDRYKIFIRAQPCVVSGCANRSSAHHAGGIVSGRGVGIKGSDFECVPVCHEHHMVGQTIGWLTFEDKFSVDLRREKTKCLSLYAMLLEESLWPKKI